MKCRLQTEGTIVFKKNILDKWISSLNSMDWYCSNCKSNSVGNHKYHHFTSHQLGIKEGIKNTPKNCLDLKYYKVSIVWDRQSYADKGEPWDNESHFNLISMATTSSGWRVYILKIRTFLNIYNLFTIVSAVWFSIDLLYLKFIFEVIILRSTNKKKI